MKSLINKLLSLALPLTLAIPIFSPAVNVFAAPTPEGKGPEINQAANTNPNVNNYRPLPPSEHQEYPQPPNNWDPIIAPAKELEFYGYPPRPFDKDQFEPWRKIVLAKFHNRPHMPHPSDEIPNTRIIEPFPNH